jgi:hypothetical protein
MQDQSQHCVSVFIPFMEERRRQCLIFQVSQSFLDLVRDAVGYER